MKTLTEFSGFALKNAIQLKKDHAAAGKTAEEIPAALGEALKLEGDKLAHFMNALEVAESKPDHLKRVIVYTLSEGEKLPQGALQKEDKCFLAEYFYVPTPKKARHPSADKFKGKKKGKRRGGKREGGGREGRNPRQNRPPLAVQEAKKEGAQKPLVTPNPTPAKSAPASEPTSTPSTEQS